MESQVFRQKNIDRISSPDQLQDYMRVTNPGIWMVLAAVVALLAGLIVSSALATLESSIAVDAKVSGGTVLVDLPLSQKDTVAPGMTLRIGDREIEINFLYQEMPDTVTAMAEADGLPDGVYSAEFVTETISPIKLLTN